jgi:hypothetical protein
MKREHALVFLNKQKQHIRFLCDSGKDVGPDSRSNGCVVLLQIKLSESIDSLEASDVPEWQNPKSRETLRGSKHTLESAGQCTGNPVSLRLQTFPYLVAYLIKHFAERCPGALSVATYFGKARNRTCSCSCYHTRNVLSRSRRSERLVLLTW